MKKTFIISIIIGIGIVGVALYTSGVFSLRDSTDRSWEEIQGTVVSYKDANIAVLDAGGTMHKFSIPSDVQAKDADNNNISPDTVAVDDTVSIMLDRKGEDTITVKVIRVLTRGVYHHYFNADYGVIVSYPSLWVPDATHTGSDGIPTRFSGTSGFFGIDAVDVAGGTLEEAVGSLAYHRLKPYGDAPNIRTLTSRGNEAAIIIPREDAIQDAALVVRYPSAHTIHGGSYQFFVLYADKGHIERFSQTLVLFENTFTDSALANLPPIILLRPFENERASESVTIAGFARVFENQLQVRVRLSDGSIIREEPVMASAPDVGSYGAFHATIVFTPEERVRIGSSVLLMVEAFDYSAKDGTEIDTVRGGVLWEPHDIETTSVKLFFIKTNDAGVDCSRVYPVTRVVEKTRAVARSALEELFKGPTSGERELGYDTSIASGVTIQKLAIQNGTAFIDLDKTVETAVGGSCRVMSIRSQIEETLKQFPTVERVILSIDGRTEDILQP